jgi:UDP-GlcNAc:undecaprenyl-phosphate GlcNAc-1-phosphate transferase
MVTGFTSGLLWMTGKAFVIALILTPIIRDISRSFNVLDRPGKRKVHVYPLPRVGGVAIAVAYGVSLISFSGSSLPAADAIPAWRLLPAAALVFLTGLVDDIFSLKPIVKVLGLAAAATVAYFSGIRMGGLADQPLGMWLELPLTVLWLVATSNALNLIDGLDGLCAGMGLMSTLALFTAAVLHHNYPLAYATLPLAGALLGFLCYNINPATVFLGDSGALLIGFLLGCYGMIWTQKAATLLSMMVPLLALSVPLLDVSLSVLRRFLRRQPIFTADRGHIHHRLLDRGLSARQAVWVLYLFAALAAAMALLASSFLGTRYQGFIILAFCGVALIGIRQLRYLEFGIASRLLFRGEFHRTVNVRLQVESVAAALEGASSEEEWWGALIRSTSALNLTAVRWTGPHGGRENRKPGGEFSWSFSLPLSESDTIELEGGFSSSPGSLDLVGLGEAMQRTFRAKLSNWRPASAGRVSPVLP